MDVVVLKAFCEYSCLSSAIGSIQVFIFIFILLFSEEHVGKVCVPLNKAMLFIKPAKYT